MDKTDTLLLSAWSDLLDRVRRDPGELARRLKRRARSGFTRPPRAWCLCTRASDKRLKHEVTAFFDEELAKRGEPHEVTLPGWGIRKLVEPVRVPWPGVRLRDAAARLGMDPAALNVWVRHGVFTLTHDYCRPHGYRGPKCPIIWAAGPLDPNGYLGRPPDEPWGTLWQSHAQRIPEEFTCTLERVPRFRTWGGRQVQIGWSWVCPGLKLGDRQTTCGRTANRVYAPVTPWTIQRFLGEAVSGPRDGAGDGENAGLDPDILAAALRDPLMGKRTLACQRCWRVRYTEFAHARPAWNDFVTHISAGLLSGRDVPMPESFRDKRRRRHRYRYRNIQVPGRRLRILERVLAGRTSRQIAAELGVGYRNVTADIDAIFRQHGVNSRAELAAAMGVSIARRRDRAEGESNDRKAKRVRMGGPGTPGRGGSAHELRHQADDDRRLRGGVRAVA